MPDEIIRMSQGQWEATWNMMSPIDRKLDDGGELARQGYMVMSPVPGLQVVVDQSPLADDAYVSLQAKVKDYACSIYRNRKARILFCRGRCIAAGNMEHSELSFALLVKSYGAAWFGSDHPTAIFGNPNTIRKVAHLIIDHSLALAREGERIESLKFCRAPLEVCNDMPDDELLFLNEKYPDEDRLHFLAVFRRT